MYMYGSSIIMLCGLNANKPKIVCSRKKAKKLKIKEQFLEQTRW